MRGWIAVPSALRLRALPAATVSSFAFPARACLTSLCSRLAWFSSWVRTRPVPSDAEACSFVVSGICAWDALREVAQHEQVKVPSSQGLTRVSGIVRCALPSSSFCSTTRSTLVNRARAMSSTHDVSLQPLLFLGRHLGLCIREEL